MITKCVNYAHRGASAYAPENTFASFYMGWRMGADGIETDVRNTSDGVPVLFHDDDLKRLTGIDRKICDMTYAELCGIDVGLHKGECYKGERVPTLEEFVHHFSGKDLHLALEIKQAGIERQVLDTVLPAWRGDRLVITSFIWDALLKVRALAPETRTGFLTGRQDAELIAQMRDNGIWQYCPDGRTVTEETVKMFRAAGFSIRAWGVTDEAVMDRMVALGVDGMTVNFPDKLQKALGRK